MSAAETMILSEEPRMNSFEQAYGAAQRLHREVMKEAHIPLSELSVIVGAVAMNGSVLFQGPVGTGKTTTAKALAKATGGYFNRTQGTPDVMPTDITGNDIYNRTSGEMEFRHGPIFSNVYLIDEVNRMSPRTQSGLLEGMQERQVTVNGNTYKLPTPQVFLATENPNEEAQGTYPLTSAGTDRFNVTLLQSPLSRKDHKAIIALKEKGSKAEQVVDDADLQAMNKAISEVEVPGEVADRAISYVEHLREHPMIDDTASMLGSYRPVDETMRYARAFAFFERSSFVEAKHIDRAARYTLPHRTVPTYEALSKGGNSHMAIDSIRRVAIDGK